MYGEDIARREGGKCQYWARSGAEGFASGDWVEGGGGQRSGAGARDRDEPRRDRTGVARRRRERDRARALSQGEWAALPFSERAAVLRRAGQLFEENAEEISGWNMRESGAIGPKAGLEVHIAAQECYEAAALAAHPTGTVLRSEMPRLSFSRRIPVGVVGVIAPFNFPLILSIRSVAPALALGNAVVLKPDPRTAISGGVVLARIFAEAGLPRGLLSVLPGGADVGEALVIDPAVRVIAFTGSTRAGRAVGALGAQHLKRVHLELGGNSALIVMDDVDVEKAVSVGAFGSFMHQGQICMTTGRHLVDARILEDYVRALGEHADHLPVGRSHLGNRRARSAHRRDPARSRPPDGDRHRGRGRHAGGGWHLRGALLPPNRAARRAPRRPGLRGGGLRTGRAHGRLLVTRRGGRLGRRLALRTLARHPLGRRPARPRTRRVASPAGRFTSTTRRWPTRRRSPSAERATRATARAWAGTRT